MKGLLFNERLASELCLSERSTFICSNEIEDRKVLVVQVGKEYPNAKDLDCYCPPEVNYNLSLYIMDDSYSLQIIGWIEIDKDRLNPITSDGYNKYIVKDYGSFITPIKINDDYHTIWQKSSPVSGDVYKIVEYELTVLPKSEKLICKLPVIEGGVLHVYVSTPVYNFYKQILDSYDKAKLLFACHKKDLSYYLSEDYKKCKIPQRIKISILGSGKEKDSLEFDIDSLSLDGIDPDSSFYTELNDNYMWFFLSER